MPPDPEYGTSDYWERRYAERVDEQTFEWYGSFVALEDAIVAALPSTKALILHVGNGNSALPERLWACGYTWQHASDISHSEHPNTQHASAHHGATLAFPTGTSGSTRVTSRPR